MSTEAFLIYGWTMTYLRSRSNRPREECLYSRACLLLLPSDMHNDSKQILEAIRRATEALAHGDSVLAKAALVQGITDPVSAIRVPANMMMALSAADADVESAKELLDGAKRKMSGMVKELLETYGPGPYLVRGKRMVAVARTTAGGMSWFLRELGDSSIPPPT